MMKTRYLIAVLGLVSTLQAQQPPEKAPPLPPGPIIAPSGDFAKWIVMVKIGDAAPSEEGGDPKTKGQVLRIGVTKTGNIRHDVQALGSQVLLDNWYVDGAGVTINPRTKIPQVALDGASPGRTDFPELEWISSSNYIGTQKVGGREAFVFRAQVPRLAPGSNYVGDQSQNVDAMAHIDVETRLPISMKRGDDSYSYQFSPRPAMQTPPAEILQAIQSFQKRLKRAGGGPAREKAR